MKRLIYFLGFLAFSNTVLGQVKNDTSLFLSPLNVHEQRGQYNMQSLPNIQGTYIFSGKKTEKIEIQGLDASIADKNPRQIFSKIPGIFIYDMDGTGNQINISARGLDPHRGWEFNIRKDGVITNTDLYGYPASHFSLPMEAVQNIELVRGTGSLQYGSQFGGMLNYISKEPTTEKKIQYQTTNTIGSFGLMSTYHEIQGKLGKFRYFIYANKRSLKGYRESSASDSDAESIKLIYKPGERFSAKLDVSHSNYVIQLAGPLSDVMFEKDPTMAIRNRNYYQPNIYIPSLTLNWKISETSQLSWLTSAVYGQRNSVMFDKPSNVVDAIDPFTLQYAKRQVDIDNYHSHNSELRYLKNYTLGKAEGNLSAGVQVFWNDLHRRQQGVGTSGSDYDLSIEGKFGRDLNLISKNVALFVENQFKFGKKVSLSPGFRVENGFSEFEGYLKYAELVPFRMNHKFPLFGINGQIEINQNSNIYGGWSQAYRPIVFKDLIPGSIYEKTDPNIQDSKGWNTELGYRIQNDNWKIDLNYFGLMYQKRSGTIAYEEAGTAFNILRTNIGDSYSNGLESLIEYKVKTGKSTNITVFTSTAYIDARYINGNIKVGDKNVAIKGNKVESTPPVISRNGFTLRHKKYSSTVLYSYTAKSYADALNTQTPSATGSVGLVPAYGVLDFNQTYRVGANMVLKLNANNIFDKQYFTKRPQFYPGPGIWPSDGRNFNFSVSFGV